MIDLQELWAKVLAETELPPRTLHGPDHWARVERNGIYIARRCGGDELVVRLFALFHDCRRVQDGHDPDHGKRGAEYLHSIVDHMKDLSPAQFEALCNACEGHTDEHLTDDPTIGACWDADRLDVGRAGLTPDETYFSCEAAKEIVRSHSYRSLNEIALRDV
jgi:uncharacterized protein